MSVIGINNVASRAGQPSRTNSSSPYSIVNQLDARSVRDRYTWILSS